MGNLTLASILDRYFRKEEFNQEAIVRNFGDNPDVANAVDAEYQKIAEKKGKSEARNPLEKLRSIFEYLDTWNDVDPNQFIMPFTYVLTQSPKLIKNNTYIARGEVIGKAFAELSTEGTLATQGYSPELFTRAWMILLQNYDNRQFAPSCFEYVTLLTNLALMQKGSETLPERLTQLEEAIKDERYEIFNKDLKAKAESRNPGSPLSRFQAKAIEDGGEVYIGDCINGVNLKVNDGYKEAEARLAAFIGLEKLGFNQDQMKNMIMSFTHYEADTALALVKILSEHYHQRMDNDLVAEIFKRKIGEWPPQENFTPRIMTYKQLLKTIPNPEICHAIARVPNYILKESDLKVAKEFADAGGPSLDNFIAYLGTEDGHDMLVNLLSGEHKLIEWFTPLVREGYILTPENFNTIAHNNLGMYTSTGLIDYLGLQK